MVPYNDTGRKLSTAFHLRRLIQERTKLPNVHPVFLGNDVLGHVACKLPWQKQMQNFSRNEIKIKMISYHVVE